MAPPPVPAKGKQDPANTNGNSSGNADDGVGMTSSELSAIRSRYLGVDKKKRPVRKLSDRKFVFDWAEQDDTFAMDSPSAVGSQRQGAAVMFGRGHLAGMENTSIPHLPPRPDTSSMALDPRKKAPADERHWTEKPLEEMKDRDWRIFREDFSISARGSCTKF
jgi:ATP-dependent RNA helicase DDX23/PRP28